MKITKSILPSPIKPTWCPGCGNFGILRALYSALEELGLNHEDLVMIYGVGCCSNEADFNNVYGIHSLHGRSIPTAIGVKLANHRLKVISIGGDGDQYGEGANHFLFAARGNHDITMLVHNNWRYSLTTGQASPTTPQGTVTKTTPEGLIEMPFNPLTIALSAQATFVAQGYSGNIKQLTEILKAAITHRGFALVDTIQPCVSFDKEHDYNWFRQHVAELPADYDSSNWDQAFALARSDRQQILTGIYYQNEQIPAYHEQIASLKEQPLVASWTPQRDLTELMAHYA